MGRAEKEVILLFALILLTGCAIKKPIRALYCADLKPDGRCAIWAIGQGPGYPSCESSAFGGKQCSQ